MVPSTIRKLIRPTVQSLPRLLEIVPPLSRAHLPDLSKANDSDPIIPSLLKSYASTHPPAYPTFSFEFFLDPKFQTPLHVRPETGIFEEETSDEDCVIRADSVKKKRKKKMNKHKLRKLRKRLSRKT